MSQTVPALHESMTRLAVLSHATITQHQHPAGAYPAAPTFSAYRGYTWFRDGAFIADGVSRFGDVQSASGFHDWCSRVLVDRQARVDSLLGLAARGQRPDVEMMLPTRFTLDGEEGPDPWWDFQLDGYGTWLWSLVAHADRHRLDLARWSSAIEVAVDYLTAFWASPCYDWWEENPEQRHVSTLGAIYGGLRGAAGSGLLDPRREREAERVAAEIRELVLAEGVSDGHLTKWLGTSEIDASLLSCITPFRLLDPDDPRAVRTVREVREQLTVGHGTHRYLADVFYGGGQWPLLTCLLGWNLHVMGDAAGAAACLSWAADQADESRFLPEQVGHHLLAPEHEREWVDRWGSVATPLLWSHGMFLTLATELMDTAADAASRTLERKMLMIRHNPPGRGHRYRDSLDQRVPVHPVAGEPVRLGVLADPGVSRLVAEIEQSGEAYARELFRLDATDPGSGGQLGDGHLAAAAESGEETGGLEPWAVDVDSFAAGQPVRYRFRDPATGQTTRWWSFVPASWQSDGGELTVIGEPRNRLVAGSVSWLVAACAEPDAADAADAVTGPLRVRFALRLTDDEHVVGLGERFHALDQRGWAVDAEVFEQYCSQGVRTYLPVPFAHVVGGSGWGFHVDTTRRVWFDVGRRDTDLIWIEVTVSPTDATVLLRLWSGDPATVLTGFLDRVGRPGLIPDWAYRPWISGNEWNSEARVEAEVTRSFAEGIPVGVVVIEAWSDEGTIHVFRDARYEPTLDGAPHRLADFSFPADGAWPDPVGMVERLHAQGIRVLLWQIPVIPDHDLDDAQLIADRRALVENGLAVREADGTAYRNRGWWFPGALLPDFTSAEARRWWTEKRRYLLEEVGIDGFKTDGGEHTWGDELRFADGTRGDVSNNRYPNLYAQAYHELIRSSGRDALTFSRSGHAGAGSFPAHWAGDERSTWEAYRASVTAGLTAGASGVFAWGWDHGGFSGEIPEPELYLRTTAMACLCPIMQYHAEFNHHRTPSNDRTPWNIAERTGRPEVLDVYRRFAVLRDRLVDYLIEQARVSVDNGRPLMRPLFFEWPHDSAVWQYPSQYLLGDDLLVAPVIEPGVERWAVYLPEGEWVDVWTGDRYDGEQVVELPAPIERIPVLARAAVAERHLPRFAGLPG